MGIIEGGIVALLSAIGGWFGGYFGSYFKKKGENLATKEDIADLTRRTKEIEVKIEDQVWNRQRHWEMKKEAVFEVMQTVGRCRDALFNFAMECFPATIPKDQFIRDRVRAKFDPLDSALDELDQKRTMALLVCGAPFTDAVVAVQKKMRSLMYEIEKDDSAFDSGSSALKPLIGAAFSEARKELGTHEILKTQTITPQPNVPAAIQDPDLSIPATES